MIYAIAAIVLLVIIAPIFAVLPSRRQKEQMALRKRAMGDGINVELTSIDDPVPKQDKYLSSTGKRLEARLSVVAYRMARPRRRQWQRANANWCLERRAEAQDKELPGTWCWVPAHPPELSPQLSTYLVEQLSRLPEDVVRIDEVGRMVSVYWQELSGDAGLQCISDFLAGSVAVESTAEDDGSDDANDHP